MPPTLEHEAPIEMVRDRPELVTELLSTLLGVEVPDHDRATVEASDFTECLPAERRADSVVVFRKVDANGRERPVLGVIFEVQRRPDSSQVDAQRGAKTWAWPDYVVSLRSRWQCPVMLLVFCDNATTAAWAAQPIEIGHPEFVLRPLVIGPKSVPVITAYEDAPAPEIVALSVAMHGSEPGIGERVLEAFAKMIGDKETIVEEHKERYVDFVYKFLPERLHGKLREIMTAHAFDYVNPLRREAQAEGRAEGQAEGRAEGRAEGQAEDRADATLTLLEARGVEVPESARQTIEGCDDLALLKMWFQRAVTAASIEDVLQ